jgi:hypothetical protein
VGWCWWCLCGGHVRGRRAWASPPSRPPSHSPHAAPKGGLCRPIRHTTKRTLHLNSVLVMALCARSSQHEIRKLKGAAAPCAWASTTPHGPFRAHEPASLAGPHRGYVRGNCRGCHCDVMWAGRGARTMGRRPRQAATSSLGVGARGRCVATRCKGCRSRPDAISDHTTNFLPHQPTIPV